MTLDEKFWERVEVRGPDECWPWTAGQRGGYGRFWTGEKKVSAHRFAYETTVGPVPDGLVLDHTCHDPSSGCSGGACLHRLCCNPAHLEAVTPAENTRRGATVTAQLARSHCPHGHPYSGDNLYVWRHNRYCRACNRGWKRTPGGCPACHEASERKAAIA